MSKELTPLQAFNKIDVDTKNNYVDEFIIIQKALKDAEKNKKALEIIKEKILDMDYFNIIAERCDLTYQEYELLKEILKWVITLFIKMNMETV